MHNDVQQHIDEALAKVRSLFDKAATRIEALKPGEKIPATKLAEDLAHEQGQSGPQLYTTLLILFKGYPGVEIKKGAHGGICRLPLVKENTNPVSNTTEDVPVK
jgi:hypothetical protein